MCTLVYKQIVKKIVLTGNRGRRAANDVEPKTRASRARLRSVGETTARANSQGRPASPPIPGDQPVSSRFKIFTFIFLLLPNVCFTLILITCLKL